MTVIIGRSSWGAPPAHLPAITLPSERLWLHHTAAENHGPEGVRAIRRYHIEGRGYSDIAYNFLVDRDGTIYEGRGAGKIGAHTRGDNQHSHAISAMGNYDVQPPTRALIAGIADLVVYGRLQGWWHTLTGGHRDAPAASTACPGRHLYAAIPDIRALTSSSPIPDPTSPTDLLEEDGMKLLIDTGSGEGWLVEGRRAQKLGKPGHTARLLEAQGQQAMIVRLDNARYFVGAGKLYDDVV